MKPNAAKSSVSVDEKLIAYVMVTATATVKRYPTQIDLTFSTPSQPAIFEKSQTQNSPPRKHPNKVPITRDHIGLRLNCEDKN